MKIGLNATLFRPGWMGGAETYFRNLLSSLQGVDEKNLYLLLCDRHYLNELPLSNINFQISLCNFTKPSPGWFVRGVIRHATKIDILRPVMNRLEVDVIHHPFSILNPLHLTIPSVLTFHDMQHEFFPEYFSRYEMKVRKEFYRLSAEQATRIIAISGHTKSNLVEKYGINPEKIDVVYSGYNPAFRVIADTIGAETVGSKYGLDRPYMFYPAATWPHKNHQRLLSALSLMKTRHGFDGHLVLSGVAMQSHGKILEEIGRLGLEDVVKVLGYLPVNDLPAVYNSARLLVFPSLFEGFGLPLVEAMACGCPIACADATSIPEIVGDAGVIFDPLSPEDMAEKVWTLWEDETLRKEMQARGAARVGQFSWETNARQTIKIYQKAVSS